MTTAQLKLIKDVRDESGDTDFYLPAGEIVDFVSDEGDYVIAKTEDGKVSFPLDQDEYKPAPDAMIAPSDFPQAKERGLTNEQFMQLWVERRAMRLKHLVPADLHRRITDDPNWFAC